MTGAGTVVAAMATPAWEGTRERVVDVFRRRDVQRAAVMDAQLRADAELVQGAGDDMEGVRDDLVRPWSRRLAALLRDHPEAAGDLRALVDEAAAARRTERSGARQVTA
ncbi:hypothetical protein OG875_05895 [Streptomyces sp. NBC_01498]|uniref:hypothetical protein n=1 Tax=Streptomyces sp. NBC_01498 TaxID=2975870 RepID=UPI002E7B5B51|nr:hypothetical protein [Streptomyces sp. NBC_01498]WTL24182.1 hypothetical protein OG875_05895 [Streptomyces sp. NBC_01498]